jgi:hypothetical protein
VTDWDLGTTEPGSSGSGLWDQNHRLIGQLQGGYAACGNDLSDWYGRFSVSWDGGGTGATRLRNWLDPGNTGAMVLDGVDPNSSIWSNAADLGGGWKWLDWFGYFNVSSSPWIYHMEHGWLYTFGQTTDSIVFWDHTMVAFWWTSESVYPSLYRFSDGAWLWYLKGGSPSQRWMYNFTSGQWESI